MSTEQLIEDLPAEHLRELLERKGYSLPYNTSESCMRATVLGDYNAGLIAGREIRALFDDRNEQIEAHKRIIAAYTRAFAAIFAALEPEVKARAIRSMDEK